MRGGNWRKSAIASQGKAVPDGGVREQCVGIEEGVIRDVTTAKIEEPWRRGLMETIYETELPEASPSDTFAPLFALGPPKLKAALLLLLPLHVS